MTFTNRRIHILFGSQTGNAEDVAERIWRESKQFYFIGRVQSMDDFNILQLVNEDYVIFVCSTTGQGDEPDNMKRFWKFLLRKDLPPGSLSKLRFAILGLGDSSYAKFNFAAKRLNKRLVQLGAEAIVPLGLGDDQHDLGYDAVADPWIESLWTSMLHHCPLPHHVTPLRLNAINPRFHVSTRAFSSSVSLPESIYNLSRPETEFNVVVERMTRTTSDAHFQVLTLEELIAISKSG